MRKIGLTGGIGSGKSMVSKIFEILGVPVFNSDIVARNLFASEDVVHEIMQKFGKDVFTNFKFDRAKMATLVFNNKKELEKLNNIVHPRVAILFNEWTKIHSDKNYVIKESAIIFEYGLENELDQTILICSPEPIRIDRVRKRDGLSEIQIRERINNQWTDEKKVVKANYQIVNDNKQMLIPQVFETDKAIRSLNL